MVLILEPRKLESRAGRLIPNLQRTPLDPGRLERNIAAMAKSFPAATLRSTDTTYNCVGMALANRRTAIEPSDLREILIDDEYVPIAKERAVPGDLVVYTDGDGEPSHVAVITHFGATNPDLIFVIGAWGEAGEYIHPIEHAPTLLGKPTEFWSERKLRST